MKLGQWDKEQGQAAVALAAQLRLRSGRAHSMAARAAKKVAQHNTQASMAFCVLKQDCGSLAHVMHVVQGRLQGLVWSPARGGMSGWGRFWMRTCTSAAA